MLKSQVEEAKHANELLIHENEKMHKEIEGSKKKRQMMDKRKDQQQQEELESLKNQLNIALQENEQLKQKVAKLNAEKGVHV